MKQLQKRHSIPALLLAAAMVFSMAACGEADPTPTETTKAPAAPTAPQAATVPATVPATAPTQAPADPTQAADPQTGDPSEDAWIDPDDSVYPGEVVEYDRSLNLIRQRLEPSAAIAGVFYLGYNNGDLMDDGFYEMLTEAGYLDRYPFFTQIPMSNCAQTEGNDVYLVIPADPYAQVEVTEWGEVEGGGMTGPVLYSSDRGDPFFLQGNISDIMPNLSVTIIDSYGSTLYRYHPMLSLQTGFVVTETDPDQPVVLDLTTYGPDDIRYFEVFYPNDSFDGISTMPVPADHPDEFMVMDLLKEQRAISDSVQLNYFLADGPGLDLDLNSEFLDYINALGMEKEEIVMTSLVNTFLSCFNCNTILITVDGMVLETVHNIYADPIPFRSFE